MQACQLTITTTIEDRESKLSVKGEMELSLLCAKLVYKDENAVVTIQIDEKSVEIQRVGDYSLTLSLIEKKQTKGSLGILGATGDIAVYTDKLSYSVGTNSVLMLAQYTLLVNGQPQKTTIRLQAKAINGGVK